MHDHAPELLEPKFQPRDGWFDRSPVFRGANAAAREILLSRAVVCRFPAGAVLWTAGAEPRGLFAVIAGRVRIVRAEDGRQHAVHTEGPGATIGEVPLLAGGRYPATALAAEPTLCAVLDASTLEAAIAADPRLAMALLRRMAERVRSLVDRLDGRSARTVRQRLAGWLVRRAAGSAGAGFTLGITQAELAEELGTVREVLVRELRRLRQAGTLTRDGRGRFRVADPAELERLARG